MNQNIDMSETRELLPKQSRTRERDDDGILLPSYKRIKESIPSHTPPSSYEQQEDQEEEEEEEDESSSSSSSNSSH